MQNEKKPTEKQLSAWYSLTAWVLSKPEQLQAIETMRTHFTRSEMSRELYRTRNLYIERKLNKETVYNSSIWRKYKEESKC